MPMRKHYILSYDASRDDIEAVSDYKLGQFDLTVFWSGQRFQGTIPPDVRLYVSDGKASDFLANPISWPIVSDRFFSQIRGLVEQSCQILDVPLFREGTNAAIDGFSLMSVTTTVSALESNNRIREVSAQDLLLDPSRIPDDVHIFRLAESSTLLIVSSAVADLVIRNECEGVALLNTKSTEDTI